VAQDFDVTVSRGRLRAHRFGTPAQHPAICVPGIAANSRSFDALGERFERAGRDLIAFDLRGRACSEITPPGSYGWEHHARDIFEAADALGIERFDYVGHSMGAFVGMTAASLDTNHRIRRLVLVDGLGAPTTTALQAIVTSLSRLRGTFLSADEYLGAIREASLVTPWNEYWERHYRYDLVAVDGVVKPRTDATAVAEDAAYGGTRNPRDFWPSITMPALLLRALIPLGGPDGFIVTREDYDAFLRDVPSASGKELEANHYAIMVDPRSCETIEAFLSQ
jgi:pimeloyl-ACP methyl ester carboxylesterase